MSACPRSRRRLGPYVVLVLVTALGPPGFAAAPGGAGKEKPGAAAGTEKKPGAGAPAPVSAKGWFEKGSIHHELGEYDEAVEAYAHAFRLDPHPVYLYNVAVCHRLAGHNADALEFYRHFIAADPGSSLRAEADARIASLTKLVADATAAKTSSPTGPIAPASGVPAPVTAPPAPDAPNAAVVPPPAVATPPAAPRAAGKKRTGLVIAVGAGGGALVAGAAIVVSVLLTAKNNLDRFARDNPGVALIDQSGK